MVKVNASEKFSINAKSLPSSITSKHCLAFLKGFELNKSHSEYTTIKEIKDIIINTITLDKCVQLGIVSPYNITCVPVTLTVDEKAAYKKANKTRNGYINTV